MLWNVALSGKNTLLQASFNLTAMSVAENDPTVFFFFFMCDPF